MRVTSKGQVTIPVAVREEIGIEPGSEVEIVARGDRAEIRPVPPNEAPITEWIRRLRGSAPPGMTTDELMALTRGED